MHEELLWVRRCRSCGWLDRSQEVAGDAPPEPRPDDPWRCERCGAAEHEFVSTVGG